MSFALLLSTSCGQSPEAAKRRAVEAGERYLTEGKLNEAVIEFKNALQVDVNFLAAVHGLGRTYLAKAWYADALVELRRAEKLDPDSLGIAADLGRAFVEVNAWQEAERQAERVLMREPRNIHGLHIRAAARLSQGRAEEALRLARDASKSAPGEHLQRVQGEALLRLGKLSEAEAAFRAAISANHKDARSVAGLARVALAKRDVAEALRLFGEAKGLDQNDPRIRLGLATLLGHSGRSAEALRELEEIDPRGRSVDVLMALASLYIREGRGREAVSLVEPLVKMAPQATGPRYLLANAYLSSGHHEDAARELRELDRQLPGNPAIQLRLASADVGRGRAQEALSRLDALAKELEKVPEHHLERARALLLLGRTDEALGAATAAQRLSPYAPQPYLLVGQLRLLKGDANGAREMFAKAAEVHGGSPPAHLALGRLEMFEKNFAAALREFDAALSVDPSSLAAVRAKAEALARQKATKEAIAFVESVVKSNDRDQRLHLLQGEFYLRDRQHDKAEAAYRKAAELDPTAAEPRLALARLALSRGDEDKAIDHLRALLQRRPGHLGAVLLLTALRDKLGRPNEAVPALERATDAAPDEPVIALALGEAYLKAGRPENAIARMSELLGRQPALAAARLVRGRAYLVKGNSAAAIRDLEETARASPRAAVVHYSLARAQAAAGRLEGAKASYREAIRLDPDSLPARFGLAALSGERPDPAWLRQRARHLTLVLAQDPKNVPAREELARIFLVDDRPREAGVQLEEVLRLNLGRFETNLLMARADLAQGKREEAIGYLQAALRSSPSDPEASILLAAQLRATGRREEAVSKLEAVLRANPDLLEARLPLGRLYLETKRLPEALAAAHAIEQRAPKSPAGPLLAGEVLLAQKQPKPAADAFRSALKLRPDLAEAHRGLGQTQYALGQIEQSAESYRRALASNGKDVVSLNNLAWILAEIRKDPETALPFAAKAADLAPQSVEALDTLGWVHYRRGAYAEAEKVLGRASERAPESALVQYHLGATYAKLGRKEEAIASLRRAARLDATLSKTEGVEELIKRLGG